MAQADRRSAARAILGTPLRCGQPIGLFVTGRAVVISDGGDIERRPFALGVLPPLAGFASKLVPER